MGSPCATRSSAPAQVDGGDVLTHPRRYHERRVGGEAAQERAETLVGQLAGRERQAEADHVLQVREAADDEVAVGRVRLVPPRRRPECRG